MATRYGYAIYEWLLERGWTPAPFPPADEFVCGDLHVLHGGLITDVYTAVAIHKSRTGEYPSFLENK